jgi:bifunctional UDP-N-acetylglucosamine pyrophosphorylase/glucosamine-1-phosphate N-acetyltransferase
MTKNETAAIIMAAGHGSRMKSELPKPLQQVANRSMLKHVIATCEKAGISKIVVVISDNAAGQMIKEEASPHPTAIQKEALGEANAVDAARPLLKDFKGDILVLVGDAPLLKPETLKDMIETRRKTESAAVVAGFTPEDPLKYGRLKTNGSMLEAIVEFVDATEEEKKIKLCSAGIFCFDGSKLWHLIDQVDNNNNAGEYYLADTIEISRKENMPCSFINRDQTEFSAANTQAQLANLESIMQSELRKKFMDQGVKLIDPKSVFFSYDTEIAPDSTIEPNVIIGPNVKISKNCKIRANTVIENNASVGENSTIGPSAHIWMSEIGQNCNIGNFVEIGRSKLENNINVLHLSYIGDTEIKNGANIGGGTITCNFDGSNYDNKYKTIIDENAFIGANNSLIAPIKIGKNAYTGASSALSKDVDDNTLAVERGSLKMRKK